MAQFKTTEIVVTSQHATVGGYRLLANSPITNGDVAPILPGMPVTIVGTNTVVRACAASVGTSGVDGIIFVGNDPTLSMMMRQAGLLELELAAWDLVTGMSGGLVPGVDYFLGLTPGSITTAPPFAPGIGQCVTRLGKALTPGSLVIELGDPILL